MLLMSGCKVFLLCVLIQNSHANNIVRGKKAYQSTTMWSGDAFRATDDNPNPNYWANGCSLTDGNAYQNWLVVDLDQPHAVKSVKLVNRLDCCSDLLQQFTVSVSDQTQPYFTGNSVTPNNAQLCQFHQAAVKADVTIDCKGIKGRYIFIAKIGHLSICDMEAYGTLIPSISGPNIARGKKSYQSSTAWNGDAYRATDDNANPNYWANSCTHTNHEAYQNWLAVDLEQTYAVKSVKLINRLDCCTDRLQQFTVSISDQSKPTFTGSSITPNNAQLCELHQRAVQAEISINCTGHVGRFIFIAKTHILTLCEVEAYGKLVNHGSNIAKGMYAYQSTTAWNGDAYRATDGNANTNYVANGCTHTDDSANPNWLVVDLEQPHAVNSVKLVNRLDCCTDRLQQFTVSISDDSKPTFTGNNVTPNNALLCEFHQAAVQAEISINCKGLTGRFIFIAKTHILTLCEVEAYGTPIHKQ